jgi:CBS domain-containing protein
MSPNEGMNVDKLTVADLMSREVVAVDETATLQEAARLMVSKGIRHLPVRQGTRAVAVLSDRDLRLMVTDLVDPAERRAYMESTLAVKHASSPVISTTPETPVRDVARIFVESRIGCMPVLDADDNLLGIVTQTDLLKWIVDMSC